MTVAKDNIWTFLKEQINSNDHFSCDENLINVPGSLQKIAHEITQQRSSSLQRDNIIFLEHLCKKLSVEKRIYQAYEPTWKRVASFGELSHSNQHLLILLFLIAASDVKCLGLESQYHLKGMQLKMLNAAFVALDVAAMGETDQAFPVLQEKALQRLDELLK